MGPNAATRVALPLLFALSGCSTIPDVTVTYYYPQAKTQVQVTQSITCAKDKSKIVAVAAITPTTTYSSDRETPNKRGTLRFKQLGGTFSDADVAVGFTDDGRLKSINATSAGQGGAFIKSFLAFGSAVGAFDRRPADDAKKIAAICDEIAKFGGEKSVITLIYTANLTFPVKEDFTEKLRIDPGSATVYDALRKVGLAPEFEISGSIVSPAEVASYGGNTATQQCGASAPAHDDVVLIELNSSGLARLKLKGPDYTGVGVADLWQGDIPIPLDSCYFLPIPKARLFGKQNFVLQLSDYGSIQKLEYGNNTGAGDATDAMTAVAKAINPSAADQAAALKAQADAIAQTTRLAQCRADASACK